MDKIEILQKLRFYRNSPSRFKNEIENQGRKVELSVNQLLFLEGDACREVGFVGQGNIRVSKIGETGREILCF